MEIFNGLAEALQSMQTWAFVIAFFIGCLNGIIFGVLPGLSGSIGIALMIPFTYGMGAPAAMGLFVAALSGQTFAGSVSAILLNTPGTSPNAATTFDGYPLARQGRGGFAIGISASASFLGTLIGTAVLITLFPAMRSIIMAFSFPEFAMLGVVGLAAIAVASRGSMLKGLVSGMIGLVVSFVGFAPIGGDIRYIFGQARLYDGISVVAILIGLFAVAEALRLLASNQAVATDVEQLRFGRAQVWEGVRYPLTKPGLLIRSALIGTGIGIVPAVGGTLASFLAYFQAAKTSKNPMFGRGDPRGVLAPEAANDAKDAGSALPSLAFGIPGSADWAIILGAMVIHGIQPGPNLIRENPEVIWVAILVLVAASLVSSVIGVIAAPKLIQVTRVRPGVLAPIVLVLAVTGAFGLEGRSIDVLMAVVFGLVAFAMRAVGMPVIPLILGVILGPMVERNFLQAESTFGSLAVFVTRPISLVLVILTVGIVVYEVVSARRLRRRTPEAFVEGVHSATRPLSIAVIAGGAVLALSALVMAQDFSDSARRFPTLVAGALLAVTVAFLLVALVPPLRTRFGGLIADGVGMEQMEAQIDEEVDEAITTGAGSSQGAAGTLAAGEIGVGAVVLARPVIQTPDRRRFRLVASMVLVACLGLGTLLVGLPITVPVVLVLFFKVVALESWQRTVIYSTATLGLLHLAFVIALRMPLEGGVLLSY